MADSGAVVRKARIPDVPTIHGLVNGFATKGEMLGRSRAEIYEGIRDFFVAEVGGNVVGCAALHVNWEDLAEVRSLAVAEDRQHGGLGGALVQACLDEARVLGIPKIYALTYRAGFFEKLGFVRIPKENLPHKVWGDCLKCPLFPNCNEDAVQIEVVC